MSNEPANYRPNVKLALSTIAIKWDAQGKQFDYLLDASDADLVIDSLLADGWSIIPTEIADAAREVVEAHTEVSELTGVLDLIGPAFVKVNDRDWVNPMMVAAVHEFDQGGDPKYPGTCVIVGGGLQQRQIIVDASAAEVVALLSGGPS